MTDVCPGPCNARARKHQAYRVALRAGAKPRPEQPGSVPVLPVAGQPVWCERCTSLITRALPTLDDLAAAIEAEADGFRGAGSGERTGARRSSSARSPSPSADVLEEMYRFLTTVEDQWRDARGLGSRPHRVDPEARPLCVKWLLTQLGNILAHPGSVRFGVGVLAWQQRLQELAHAEPVARARPAVRCPRCDRLALRRRDDGLTECAKCGRWLNEKEYQELADQQAREDEQGKAVEAS